MVMMMMMMVMRMMMIIIMILTIMKIPCPAGPGFEVRSFAVVIDLASACLVVWNAYLWLSYSSVFSMIASELITVTSMAVFITGNDDCDSGGKPWRRGDEDSKIQDDSDHGECNIQALHDCNDSDDHNAQRHHQHQGS